MVIFHCYVSSPEGISYYINVGSSDYFFPNVDHTWSTWLEKSANNKPNLTPDLQALVSKRRELRDQESYGRSVPSYSKSVKMGPHIHSNSSCLMGAEEITILVVIARPWPSDLVTAMAQIRGLQEDLVTRRSRCFEAPGFSEVPKGAMNFRCHFDVLLRAYRYRMI